MMNRQEYHSYIGEMLFDLNEFPTETTEPLKKWVTSGTPMIYWKQMFNNHKYWIGISLFINNPPTLSDIVFLEDDIDVNEIPQEVAVDSLKALGFFPTGLLPVWPILLFGGLLLLIPMLKKKKKFK